MMKPYFPGRNQIDVADNRNVHPLIRTLFPEKVSEHIIITSVYEFRKDAVHIPTDEEVLQDQAKRVNKQLYEIQRRNNILETKYNILKPILDNDEIGVYKMRMEMFNRWKKRAEETIKRIETKLSRYSIK